MATEDRYSSRLNVTPGQLIRAIEEPVRVGSLLWVFTDPHRGHEFAYNRWYERDHYYAGCLIGAWNFAGSRWVATRRHKDARLPAVTDMPFSRDAGSYACLYYLLDGHHDEWEAWSTPQVHALYAADRGFQSRTHYNTGFFRYEWRAYRDPDPIPLELALDHRYPGLVAQFVEPVDSSDRGDVDGLMEQMLPGWLAGSPVASVSSWSAVPLPATKPDFVPTDAGADRRILQLFFLEEDPLRAWDHHRELVEQINRSGVARVVFAAPFIPTDVGTDRYVDELW